MDYLTQFVTIAILAKNSEVTLPTYLQCIESQTWPKEQTYLYVRTNNNRDQTRILLLKWIEKVSSQYKGVYFDDTDVAEKVELFENHEWNTLRFKVLGKIRQESLMYALEKNSHYFIADTDNFVIPETIENMVTSGLPIVAPMLLTMESPYSNYHSSIDKNGYFLKDEFYYPILHRNVKGLIEVPVVHCTYFVRNENLKSLHYDDNSGRFEYVIFSHSARLAGIPQYIDNRRKYGWLTFATNAESFSKELEVMKLP